MGTLGLEARQPSSLPSRNVKELFLTSATRASPPQRARIHTQQTPPHRLDESHTRAACCTLGTQATLMVPILP
jgi:hypothetical protein